jgi:hypothetical protein
MKNNINSVIPNSSPSMAEDDKKTSFNIRFTVRG